MIHGRNKPRLRARGVFTGTTALLLALGTTGPASALDCAQLKNPVYLPATTLLESLLGKVGPKLADERVMGDGAMTIVHFPLSSCLAYETHKDQLPLVGTATYYAPDGMQRSCEMAEGSSIKADLSAMDVGGAVCLGGERPPANLTETPSHVETIGFVVPRNSSQTAITATEAYYLMKFGGQPGSEIAPWTNPNFVMIRNPGSSTQLTIGASIGISGTQWNGSLRSHQGSGNVRDAVIAENTTGNAEKTIGILNSSQWEKASDNMKVLAFQAFNNCLGAVYPDSTATSRDKRNVRDGHYPIWTNLRYFVYTDATRKTTTANGAEAAARVERFIRLMTGAEQVTGLEVAKSVIATGDIPACAMHVAREVDGGPIASFAQPVPCDCFFLEQNGVASGCKPCEKNEDCAGGACRFGYCEPR